MPPICAVITVSVHDHEIKPLRPATDVRTIEKKPSAKVFFASSVFFFSNVKVIVRSGEQKNTGKVNNLVRTMTKINRSHDW